MTGSENGMAGMSQQLQGEWAEPSILPKVSKLADTRSDVRNAAGWVLDPTGYRSATDHVVAAFVPELRDRITDFYAGRGAPLRVLFARAALARIDQQLGSAIPLMCEEWRAFKANAERRGTSTKEAAATFARGLAPLVTLSGELATPQAADARFPHASARATTSGHASSVRTFASGGTVQRMRVMPSIEPSPAELKDANCWFAVDRVTDDPAATAWKRLARWRQNAWRASRSLPPGFAPYAGGPKARRVGSRLALRLSKSTAANFLTPGAVAAVKSRLAYREPHEMLSADRLWADLLSSMPLCFNLFGDVASRPAAARAVRIWWPDAPPGTVALRFEHSPGRRNPAFLGNRSAFDAAFEIDRGDGTRAVIGIETKYHEHAKAETAPPKNRLARYEEVTARSGAFLSDWTAHLVGTDLQQIWLDHLLVLSMLQHPSRQWTWGRFVLVYPAGNPSFASAAARYRSVLRDPSTFQARTIEELVEAPGAVPATTAKLIRERYL